MPIAAAIPAILGLGGAAISAIGGSKPGSAGSTNTSFNQQGSSTTNQKQDTNQSQTTTPNEDPMFTIFRQSILPALAQQYNDAQKPVYGDAQVAQNITDANKNATAAEGAATGALARRGVLNSGATTSTIGNIEQGKTAGITSFQNSLPALNDQIKSQRTNDLLGLAANFLGRSPTGTTTTGNLSTTASNDQKTNASGTGTGQASGPGIGSSLLNLGGGILQGIGSGIANNNQPLNIPTGTVATNGSNQPNQGWS